MPTEISTVLGTNGNQSSTRAGDGPEATNVHAIRQELPAGGNTGPERPAEPDFSNEQVGEIVEDLNSRVQDIRRELRFSVNENNGKTVITVVDSETEEVVRQIPPEEVVALSEYFEEHTGLLMNARV